MCVYIYMVMNEWDPVIWIRTNGDGIVEGDRDPHALNRQKYLFQSQWLVWHPSPYNHYFLKVLSLHALFFHIFISCQTGLPDPPHPFSSSKHVAVLKGIGPSNLAPAHPQAQVLDPVSQRSGHRLAQYASMVAQVQIQSKCTPLKEWKWNMKILTLIILLDIIRTIIF